MPLTTYATKIKDIRAERDLTQIQAANQIGIVLESLRQVEQGKPPGPRVKKKIDDWMAKK